MASWFEFRLVGLDAEHLRSVGEAMLDDVEHAERLLTRFSPSGSLARVNREAGDRPLRIEHELYQVLRDCQDWHRRTDGWFNPCRPRTLGANPPIGRFGEILVLDESGPRVQWLDPRFEIDLGGFGKGYALDRSARLLGSFGIDFALLEGGTSSALTVGVSESGNPWVVAIRDPLDPEATAEVARCPLQGGLSSSAAFAPGSRDSDVIDPSTGRPLSSASACSVLAPSATEAEVLSTALLAMGRERSKKFLARNMRESRIRVLWIDCDRGQSHAEWLDCGEGGAP